MSAIALLQELARLGVKLTSDGENLKVKAAKGVLSVALQKQLKDRKEEIIDLLQQSGSEDQQERLPRIRPDSGNLHQPFPLSDLQWGFYVADDPFMEYHVRPHYYLENDRDSFDLERYEAAWNKTLHRHRNEICVVNRELNLRVLEKPPTIRCRICDLRNLSAEESGRELVRLRERLKRRELPLDRWPWIELLASVRRENGGEKVRIHYNHNNFFCDGFSMGLILSEVEGYYEDPELELPELELTYRDAVLALSELAESEIGRAARHYWFQRLAALPPPPPLPQLAGLDRRRRSKLERRGRKMSVKLWESFKAQAVQHGVTVSNAVIAAYAEVISIWSASRHFILSQMVTRRFAEMHPEIKHIFGNFASLYPLEIDLRERVPFFQRARRLQEQVFLDLKQLEVGGMEVMQELNRLSGEFGSVPSPFVVGSGLFDKDYRKADFACLETSQTLLDFQYWELPDGSLFYVWDLLEEFFPAGLVDSMWRAFDTLLKRLAEDRESWKAVHFDLVSGEDLEARRRRNRTQRPIIEKLLWDHEERSSSADPALVNSQGTLTYRELHEWSLAVAKALREVGCERGDLVAIVADRGQELLAAVMGVLRAGCAYVPLEPSLPKERLHVLLSDSESTVVLTQNRYAETLAWPADVKIAAIEEYRGKRSAQEAASPPAVSAEDLAYVIYTSGSTGKPKGVMIDHRGALNTVLDVNERFSVNRDDKIFGVSSFSFDLSVYDIFGSFHSGACLVYPDAEAALNPAHWLDVMIERGVTIWNSVPALMRLLVETARRQKVELPILRLVLLSGDKIPLDLPGEIEAIAPNARIISLGGATEASIWSIIYPIGELDRGRVRLPDVCATIPYGYPMVNQRWHVLDEDRRPCPVWVPGDLYIAGVGLAKGYWRDEEKTNAAFIVNSGTGERLYRTGDLGRYLADGCLEFLGRADFQVKIQGHRIELGEIESVLTGHPQVKEVAVVAKIVDEKGTRQLAGYAVLTEEDATTAEALQEYLRKHLPAYMVPSSWLVLESLPITSNGKVDRKALTAMDTGGDAVGETRPRRYVAPRNDVERKLVAIWEQVLELDEIGIEDDFFELGGQSFDSVRIFAIVKEEFGQAFTLGDIWNLRTIKKLAHRLHPDAAPITSRRLVPIEVERSGPPIFLVHPAGGHCTGYRELALMLDFPVYGFQADGAVSSIVDVARVYVDELREVQPSGPYFLGGWSTGGMIAFEITAQLEAVGEKVGQVILLDAPTPTAYEDLSDQRLLYWFMEDLAMDLPLKVLENADFSGRSLEEQLEKAIELFGSGVDSSFDVSQMLPVYRTFRDMVVAGSAYRPGKVGADLMVVRVEENAVSEFSDHPHRDRDDWGWGSFTSGRVDCAVVPGNHHTFLRNPVVSKVAQGIAAYRRRHSTQASCPAQR